MSCDDDDEERWGAIGAKNVVQCRPKKYCVRDLSWRRGGGWSETKKNDWNSSQAVEQRRWKEFSVSTLTSIDWNLSDRHIITTWSVENCLVILWSLIIFFLFPRSCSTLTWPTRLDQNDDVEIVLRGHERAESRVSVLKFFFGFLGQFRSDWKT